MCGVAGKSNKLYIKGYFATDIKNVLFISFGQILKIPVNCNIKPNMTEDIKDGSSFLLRSNLNVKGDSFVICKNILVLSIFVLTFTQK